MVACHPGGKEPILIPGLTTLQLYDLGPAFSPFWLSISYLNSPTHLTESSGECNKGHYTTLTAQCSTHMTLYPAMALCMEERYLGHSSSVPGCPSIFLSKLVILRKGSLPLSSLHSLQRAKGPALVVMVHTLIRFSLMSFGVLDTVSLWSAQGSISDISLAPAKDYTLRRNIFYFTYSCSSI